MSPRPPATPTKLLTVQQAAALHGIPRSTLFDLVVRGALPSVRLPGNRRVWLRAVDLENLINASVERRPA